MQAAIAYQVELHASLEDRMLNLLGSPVREMHHKQRSILLDPTFIMVRYHRKI